MRREQGPLKKGSVRAHDIGREKNRYVQYMATLPIPQIPTLIQLGKKWMITETDIGVPIEMFSLLIYIIDEHTSYSWY